MSTNPIVGELLAHPNPTTAVREVEKLHTTVDYLVENCVPLQAFLDRMRVMYVTSAIRHYGNVTKAADNIGIHRNTAMRIRDEGR
jgi:transcriptional regulator with PAS, ATPase and Fis domain